MTIRPAGVGDAELLLALVRELAAYERMEDQVQATVDGLAEHLGGPRPLVEALIASDDEAPIGFALFYTTFSTFRGAPGLWLEDIYVRPSSRGVGAGRALLAAVARVAAERGHARVQWAALDWNQQALGFYRGLGAEALPQWVWHRLEGEAMRRLAGEAER